MQSVAKIRMTNAYAFFPDRIVFFSSTSVSHSLQQVGLKIVTCNAFSMVGIRLGPDMPLFNKKEKTKEEERKERCDALAAALPHASIKI